MGEQVVDRRADTRIALPAGSVRATLRPGCEVRVVNVGPGGALVQGERPLRPGARVHVQVVTSARAFTLTARVLRCAVWTLHPVDGVTYRGALQFDDRCEPFWERGAHVGARLPETGLPDGAGRGQRLPAPQATAPSKHHRSAK